MRIHKHDLDLIADYAQGALDDEAKAAALVGSCDVCRSEFEAQTAVRESLSSVGSAHMTEHEKAALHRDLWTELTTTVTPTEASRSRSWSTWAAVGSAAALLLVMGVVGVFSGLGGSGDAAETAEEAAVPAQGLADDSAGADGEAADTTTTAGSDTDSFGFVSSNSDQSDFATLARQIRENLATEPLAAPETADSADSTRQAEKCLEEAGLEDHYSLSGFEDQTDLLIVLADDRDPRTAAISFVDPATCEVLAVED